MKQFGYRLTFTNPYAFNVYQKDDVCYFLFRSTQPKVTIFSFITLQKQETQEKLHVFREGSSLNLFSLN